MEVSANPPNPWISKRALRRVRSLAALRRRLGIRSRRRRRYGRKGRRYARRSARRSYRRHGAGSLWGSAYRRWSIRAARRRRAGYRIGASSPTVSIGSLGQQAARLRAFRTGLPKAANRRRYRRNPAPLYAYNPAGGLVGAVTKPFNLDTLKPVLPMLGGAVGNAFVGGMAASRVIPLLGISGKMAAGATVLTNLATAGLLAGLTRMVKPEYAGPVLLGGVVQALTVAYKTFLEPAIKGQLSGLSPLAGAPGFGILGDFGTLQAMEGCPACLGLGDSLTVPQAAAAQNLADVLTVGQVGQAQNLGEEDFE